MEKEPGNIPVIRAMREHDLERIIEIDNLVLGERRPEYWEGKVEMTGKTSPLPSLVAEMGGARLSVLSSRTQVDGNMVCQKILVDRHHRG